MSESLDLTPSPEPLTKRQLWQQRLQRFQNSGLSVKDFCASEGVSVPSFYSWKRRLTPPTATTRASGPESSPSFIPLRLVPDAVAPLQLVFPSGVVLQVGPDCDEQLLSRILALLGVASC
jgi:transposase